MCFGQSSWYQLGIVSFGMGCGRPQQPGYYTFVPFFEEWIDNSELIRGMINQTIIILTRPLYLLAVTMLNTTTASTPEVTSSSSTTDVSPSTSVNDTSQTPMIETSTYASTAGNITGKTLFSPIWLMPIHLVASKSHGNTNFIFSATTNPSSTVVTTATAGTSKLLFSSAMALMFSASVLIAVV